MRLGISSHKQNIGCYSSKERERRIALTSITSIVYKIVSSSIPLITLRITYDYLGVEVFGLWNAVTNFFAIFVFSDLGLGNGLQTKLSQAAGLNNIDLCNRLIGSTNAILVAVALFLTLIFVLFYPFIDWVFLMNAKDAETIDYAAVIVFIIVLPKLLSIPVAIITRTQYALQEGYNSNIWNIIGSLLSLVLIVLIVKFDFGKLPLLWSASLVPFLVSLFNMIIYYGIQRKDLSISYKWADKIVVKDLLKLGIFFCLIQILMTIGLTMDTFIVAKTCSLSEAGSFSVLYKVSIVISSVIAIFSQPLWGANGEAIAKGEYEWVRRNTKKMSLIMTCITFLGGLFIILVSEPLFALWMGDGFDFSKMCLFWMMLMQVLQSFISPYFMVLNAVGIVKLQVFLFAIFTPISFFLKYYLSNIWGIEIIPAIGAILYLFIIVIGIYVKSNSLLKFNKFEND